MDYEQVMKEFNAIKEQYPELNQFRFKTSYGKKQLGYCSYGREKTISLSFYLMKNATDEKIIETLRHECAHALDYLETGSSSHGSNWKKWCRRLGIEPNRVSSNTWEDGNKPQSKYTLTCPVCGRISHRHKMRVGAMYSCGKCSPKRFNSNYILEVTQNY